jgi:CheY-specific phosphatase CheX
MGASQSSGGRPVAGAIDDQLALPFVEAIRVAFLEMAGIEVAMRGLFRIGLPIACDLATIVELAATPPMALLLGFPERTAAALTAAILRDVNVPRDKTVVQDCVCEIANVVAGHAKTALAGTHCRFTYSLPRIAETSGSLANTFHHKGSLAAVLDCAAGEFALVLAAREAPAGR